MSTPQHAVQSGLIAFLLSWLFGFNQFFTGLHVAFAMQLGAFPDLGRLLQKNWMTGTTFMNGHIN